MKWKHNKRGSVYSLACVAEVQSSNVVLEGDKLQIYQGEDGKFWARPLHEFFDGRFSKVDD